MEQLPKNSNIVALEGTEIQRKPRCTNGRHQARTPNYSEEGIECCQVETPDSIIEVEMTHHFIPMNNYVPGNVLQTDEHSMNTINPVLSLGEPVIIKEDFNATCPLGHDEDNINGRVLNDAYGNLGAVLINSSGGPTRVAERSGDTDSRIGITMASAALAPEM